MRNLMPWRRDRGPTDVEVPRDDPFQLIQTRFHRMFDDLFRSFDASPLAGSESSFGIGPQVDVVETDEEVRVEAELPGVERERIDLQVGDDALVIRGEKRSEARSERDGWHRMERVYGSFHRSIPLPCEVRADQAEATFRDGVLRVRLPKAPDAKARTRRIEVREGD